MRLVKVDKWHQNMALSYALYAVGVIFAAVFLMVLKSHNSSPQAAWISRRPALLLLLVAPLAGMIIGVRAWFHNFRRMRYCTNRITTLAQIAASPHISQELRPDEAALLKLHRMEAEMLTGEFMYREWLTKI